MAFVSTEAFDTASGVAGADAVCRADAAAAGLPAGQYKALLATSLAAMADRVDLTGTAWVDPTGRPLVTASGDITDAMSGLLAPLAREADGSFLGDNPAIVTGAPTPGQPGFGGHCQDWTHTSGSATAVVAGFVGAGWATGLVASVECGELARVYCFQKTANLIFVSDTAVTGRVDANGDGDVEEADAMCQTDAELRGLTGSFMAYLGHGTSTAVQRLQASGASDSGWVRPDGRPVAASLSALDASQLWFPVRLHADRTAVSGDVWTGVDAGFQDTLVSETCNGWTSDSTGQGRVGHVTNGARYWHSFAPQSCAVSRYLYCLQVDPAPAVEAPAASGRMAFTASGWSPTSGLDAADQLCQQEGAAAFGGGSYKAFVTPAVGTASERFEPDGLPWVRPDGVRIAASNADLLAGGILWAPISVDAQGAFDGTWALATGAAAPTEAGNDASTCIGWSGMGSYKPTPPGYVNADWFAKQAGNPGNCAMTTAVMCLQE